MLTIPQHSDYTVMIVEDDLIVREMLRRILEINGFTVVAEAGDGVEAVASYLALRPRITLMDVSMPNKNGIDATREIVSFDGNAKVVIISGIISKELAKSALAAGATEVLSKPLKIRVLKEMLQRVLQMQ